MDLQELFAYMQRNPDSSINHIMHLARESNIFIDRLTIGEFLKLYKLARNVHGMHDLIVSQQTQILEFRKILNPDKTDEDPTNDPEDSST